MKIKDTTNKVPKWFEYIAVSIIILYIILSIINKDYGEVLVALIGGFIVIKCAEKNAEWASKINKSMKIAYIIGFMLGIFGLLGYFIYYKIKRKK